MDPDSRPDAEVARDQIKADAVRFGSILAYLFGDSLDRATMWERIGSALASAMARDPGDDLDRFATACLDHVKAGDAAASACEPLGELLAAWAARPPGWRRELLRYLAAHRVAVLVHARARWQLIKRGEASL